MSRTWKQKIIDHLCCKVALQYNLQAMVDLALGLISGCNELTELQTYNEPMSSIYRIAKLLSMRQLLL